MKDKFQSQTLTMKQALSRAKKAGKEKKTEVAIELYRAVLKNNPNHPIATKGLRKMQKLSTERSELKVAVDPTQDQINGLVNLYSSGHLIKAEQICAALLQSHPKSLVVLNILGSVLQKQGKQQEAMKCYDIVIQIKPDYINAYYNRGIILSKLGLSKRALKDFEIVIQLKPDYAEAYYLLGNTFITLGLLEKAVDSFEKSTLLNPNFAQAYSNLGVVFIELGLFENAVATFEKAVKCKPDYAEAYCNLGGALKGLGKSDKAQECYEKAIKLKPDYAEAHRNLSTLKKYKANDPQIRTMEKLLIEGKLNDSERKLIAYSLAKAYDGLGHVDQSFDFLQLGNQLRKGELKYNIDNDRRLIERIKSIFSNGSLAPNLVLENKKVKQPIFILGMPRSGTSLVEQIIATHSKVYGAGELSTMSKLASPILSIFSEQTLKQASCKEIQGKISELRDSYIESLNQLKVPEMLITDKMPLNFIWIGFILSAFPEVKIIHTSRDARATCWSIYKHYFSVNGNGFAYDMNDLTEFYVLYIDLMRYWHKHFPGRIYDQNYEELTVNQYEETRKLLEFCDLEWQDECLNFHNTKREVKTASAEQVRKKMYQGSSEAWRKYEKHIQPLINGLRYSN